jgi:hypothetical protein
VNILLAEEEIILPDGYKEMLMEDIDHEIDINLMDEKEHPPYQTEAYLQRKYQEKWSYLWSQYKLFLNNSGFGEYRIQKAWSNVTKPGSSYCLHNHTNCDLSLIHYLQVPGNSYGTTVVVDEATHRIGGIEGTAILFDSLIYHEMQWVPDEITQYRENWRYTIVLDLLREEFPSKRRTEIYHQSEIHNLI